MKTFASIIMDRDNWYQEYSIEYSSICLPSAGRDSSKKDLLFGDFSAITW